MDNIGAKIKAFRVEQTLTQRELAKRSGVSNATISVLENGMSDPTVGLLVKILDGLGKSVADLVSEPDKQPPHFFFPKEEMVDLGSDRTRFLQPGHNISDRKMQILHETYQPGGKTGPTPLQHEGEEGGFIVRGKLQITVGGQTRILSAGEAYYFNSSIPHHFHNVGDEDCVLFTACTPPF